MFVAPISYSHSWQCTFGAIAVQIFIVLLIRASTIERLLEHANRIITSKLYINLASCRTCTQEEQQRPQNITNLLVTEHNIVFSIMWKFNGSR